MARLKGWLTSIAASERSQDTVEYALITMFVAVAIVVATLGLLSPAFASWGSNVADCVAGPDTCA